VAAKTVRDSVPIPTKITGEFQLTFKQVEKLVDPRDRLQVKVKSIWSHAISRVVGRRHITPPRRCACRHPSCRDGRAAFSWRLPGSPIALAARRQTYRA